MNRLNIIGASGHGKVVADIARLNGYNDVVFYDDNPNVDNCLEYPVIGNTSEVRDGDLFIAIGNSLIRKKFMELYKDKNIITLIHPSAIIAKDVEIDIGSVIMAGTVINSGTRIGKGVIVNTSSSIDHDCVVEDYCHISVGSHLCGTVHVGNSTWIGAGATISNNINICDCCVIGAGATVIHDINIKGTYVGVPAKAI